MKNLPLLIGTLLVTTAMILGVVFVFSNQGASSSDPVSTELLMTQLPHLKGSAEAKVTIVEFSDFQCPACSSTQPYINQLLVQYPDQIKLIYRHFPLDSIHPYARLAAQAAEVAAESSQFWEYHDLLFSNQDKWSQLEGKEALIEQLSNYAEELGIDKQLFLERIESDHIKSLVNEDQMAGEAINIQVTPTFYVNGQPSPASQLLQKVESIINS